MSPQDKMRAIAQWARANASSAPPIQPQPQMAQPMPIAPPPMPIGGGGMTTGTPLTFDAMDKMRAAQMQMAAPQPQMNEDMSGYTDYPRQPLTMQQVAAKLKAQEDFNSANEAGKKFEKLRTKLAPQGPIEVSPESEDEVNVDFQE